MNVSHIGLGDESLFLADANHYNDKMQTLVESTVMRSHSLARRYLSFHLLMGALLVGESLFLLSSFFWLAQAALLSLSLAGLFLSFLAYFILRLYLQGRQPELFHQIAEDYIKQCHSLTQQEPGTPKHYLAVANACWKLAKVLKGREYRLFALPPFLQWKPLRQLVEQISCWCHWEELYRLKEHLLVQAVQEHIELVKCAPTSLEVHALLANAYVILSELYITGGSNGNEERWNPMHRCSKELQEKFRSTAERAVEELKILEEYAPNDPWVHAQLAYGYHDLQMPKEEIKEYEAMLRLNREDKSVLAKLGVLYFAQGRKAEGLRVYEALKNLDQGQAEQLIKHYNSQQFP